VKKKNKTDQNKKKLKILGEKEDLEEIKHT
jgi:hypothetical protein